MSLWQGQELVDMDLMLLIVIDQTAGEKSLLPAGKSCGVLEEDSDHLVMLAQESTLASKGTLS